MKMFTQVEEREIFNKVLEEAAKLVIEHKLAGLPLEIQQGELESIYRKHTDITDEPLFKRFVQYTKSPEGRQYFKITIRTELWKAGYRPKGWEESSHSQGSEDTMFFNVPEAREYLLKKGLVYTLRPKMRKVGKDTAFYGSFYKKEEIGPIWVDFIKEVKEPGEVQEYVSDSGFGNVEDWWKAAKGSRFLFKVRRL